MFKKVRYTKEEEKRLWVLMQRYYEDSRMPQAELIPILEADFFERFKRRINGLAAINKYHRMKKDIDKNKKMKSNSGRPNYIVMIHNGTPTSGKVTVCMDKEHLERVMSQAAVDNGHKIPEHTIFARKRFEVKVIEVDEI